MVSPMLKSFLTSAFLISSFCASTSVNAQSRQPQNPTPSPIIDSSFTSSDSKTIAQAVLKNAIEVEKLDKTAKVSKIERAGQGDIWMFAPVPYWKITIVDPMKTLTYLTTQEGIFRALIRQNGISTLPKNPPAIEIVPPEMRRAVLNQASQIWGYSMSPDTKMTLEKALWSSGCERISAPFPCDPVVRNGWTITVPVQDGQLIFRGETSSDLQLIERKSALERRLSPFVISKVREIAGKHFQLAPETIAIDNISLQNYSDSCLGLGTLVENCMSSPRRVIKGSRISVAGKAGQRQIYRMSHDLKTWRAEAMGGLPMRMDEAPTAIVRKVLTVAQRDLGSPIANLRILQATPLFECFSNPNEPPNKSCFPTQIIKGWKVLVTNNQNTRSYTTDRNGNILSRDKV
jgi:hypothetical protein